MKLWLPLTDATPQGLDVEMSRFLLTQVGDQFCDLLLQEKEATTIHMSEGNNNAPIDIAFPFVRNDIFLNFPLIFYYIYFR